MAAIGKIWIGVVVGVTIVVAGCGVGDPQAPGTSSARPTTTSAAPISIATPSVAPAATPAVRPGATSLGHPVPSVGAPTAPATTVRPPEPATGTVVLRTVTLSGIPVPGVPVYLSLQQPCDPSGNDIPVGETAETSRRDGVTDEQGRAAFVTELGCYRFGMTAPAGTNPVPEGMHSLFLVAQGGTVTGQLRFQDIAPEPAACAESTIETELGVDPGPVATIPDCDGKWGVIRWNTPGDNQRVITRTSGTWTTYVRFPHDICWSRAAADGVPDRLRTYFC
ncbi:hypothetical protein [Nocardia alba]|uniref:Uncharacterized protein n=1 Tax=Nocardia alba TaxID=225051 RepID=A0A4R1FZ50_9NOCA|nr:hypothetical protein [Nocardia alba]TCJ99084.1 hypothetical protein DFR71_0055 [Nocardia alba]